MIRIFPKSETTKGNILFVVHKMVTKGIKWIAAGKIYTQSRKLVCRNFAFAYKNSC